MERSYAAILLCRPFARTSSAFILYTGTFVESVSVSVQANRANAVQSHATYAYATYTCTPPAHHAGIMYSFFCHSACHDLISLNRFETVLSLHSSPGKFDQKFHIPKRSGAQERTSEGFKRHSFLLLLIGRAVAEAEAEA